MTEFHDYLVFFINGQTLEFINLHSETFLLRTPLY